MTAGGASLQRFADALERAQRHWRERHAAAAAAPAAPPATVAISREAGVPGTSIAREVGVLLDWPVYDHELVEEIADQMGLRVSLLESVDERRRDWLQALVDEILPAPRVIEAGYVRHLVETLLSLAAHGHCVIVGRGAPHVLPPATTLRVRLAGTREDRIAGTRYRLGISAEEAARWVDETARARRDFVLASFGKDVTDPLRYDLVLNTSRWSISECAALIVEALHRLEARLAQTEKS